MAKDQTERDTKVTDALDEYLLKTLEELWQIVADQSHPDHKRYKMDALRLLLKHTAPIRKEPGPPPPPPVIEEKSDISVQIANLFHGNSLENKTVETIAIEHKKKKDNE
jgi:hypothetical protein